MGSLSIVGIGPGDPLHMTPAAFEAIAASELVVGYTGYLSLVAPLLEGKEQFGSSMHQELDRADYALRAAAKGKRVCVIASGDACVYGIGGLVLERMSEADRATVSVTVVPGITAASAAASLLGAPLMNDYLVLSLSDLLTPRDRILKRLHAAGAGDLVVVLYNPRSRARTDLLLDARLILLGYRRPEAPVGIVRNALRAGSRVLLCTLGDLAEHVGEVDMFSTVVVGNSESRRIGDVIVTPRGYRLDEEGSRGRA